MILFGRFRLPDKVEFKFDSKQIANDTLALIKLRVFQDGMRGDDKPMSPYSTNGPIYIPLTGVGSGPPLHKPKGGQNTGPAAKNGRKRRGKTMKFRSYADFRAASGLSTTKNLSISGTLSRRFIVLKHTPSGFVLGWLPGSKQALIAEGQHTREDERLFYLSKAERKAIVELALGNLQVRLKR